MESGEILKGKLPHGAMRNIANVIGVSSVVVSKVVNGEVLITRKNGKVVRACSEKMELRIIAAAVGIIKQREKVCERNAEARKTLIDSLS